MIDYVVRGNTVTAYFNFGDDSFNSQKHHWKLSVCNILAKHFGTDMLDDFFGNVVNDLICKKMNFYGKAKCHPDDEFDIEMGKELARLRLIDNMQVFTNRCIAEAEKRFNNIGYVKKFNNVENHTCKLVDSITKIMDDFTVAIRRSVNEFG